MCNPDINKNHEEQIKVLIAAAHESERSRILNILLQEIDKLNLKEESDLLIYNKLIEIVIRIQK